jgi:hypothetical protein
MDRAAILKRLNAERADVVARLGTAFLENASTAELRALLEGPAKPTRRRGRAWILEAVRFDTRKAEAGKDDQYADQLSLDEQISRVSDALRVKFGAPQPNNAPDWSVYPIQTFDDYVIYRNSGKVFSVDYAFDDKFQVTFSSDPVEVLQRWQPIKQEAFAEAYVSEADRGLVRIEAEVLGPARETDAAAAAGREWDVLLIREGMSRNRNRYSRKTLTEAAPLYEGRPMFVDHKLETGPFGRSGTEVVGFTKDVRPVVLTQEASGKSTNTNFVALAARAGIIDEGFQKKLLASYQLGNPDLFGLSHDVRAESVTAMQEDGPYYDVTAIKKVESTDWVLTPAAGGRVLRLVASDAPNPHLQEMLAC